MTALTPATTIDRAAVGDLQTSFRGELIRPGDVSYDEHRKAWNGSIDGRPGLIAPCTGVADDRAAVRFSREHALLVAVSDDVIDIVLEHGKRIASPVSSVALWQRGGNRPSLTGVTGRCVQGTRGATTAAMAKVAALTGGVGCKPTSTIRSRRSDVGRAEATAAPIVGPLPDGPWDPRPAVASLPPRGQHS